jgi:hypothetical protein
MFCSKNTMLGTSKSIWGFDPRSIPGCTLWLDGADNATMNSTSAVTVWNDKSGFNNTMTGTGTWSGGTMVFNGTTNAFSNTLYAFPFSAYSMFAVYSNTTAPAANAYMNAVYGSNGYPMLGTFGTARNVSARSVVANTGALARTVPVQLGWAARIAGTTTSSDVGWRIATDASGNVFVTGQYGAELTVFNQGPSGTAGTTLSNAGGSDAFVAKYSSAGAVLWAARIASTVGDQGFGIATDPSGNVLVTGVYAAALTIYNQGPTGTVGTTLSNVGGNDCFVAKYSTDGAVLWAARIAGTTTSSDIGYGIATDTSGNVFVTGVYAAALTIYNQGPSGTAGTTLSNAGGTDCFVAKYSSAGAVLWAARIASTVGDQGFGIATDPSGNVLVTGFYQGQLTIYNQGPSGTAGTMLGHVGAGDCFVAKYSSAGAVLWGARIAGTSNTAGERGRAIATDASGNVFVTGGYSDGNGLTLYNQSGTVGATLVMSGVNNSDCFVAKYSSAGAVLWAARISGGSTGQENGLGIATDPSGNVLVTGNYGTVTVTIYNQGPSFPLSTTLGHVGAGDCFVAKYSTDGIVLWAARIASTASDIGRAIATDPSGNVLVTGDYGAALTIYNQGPTGTAGTTLPFTGGFDVFIVKYNPDGFITNAATSASSNVLVSATYTPSTFSPFVNGFTQNTLAGTTLTTTGLFLGGPSNYFSGSISEVLIYGTTLTAAQRQSVEGYLSRKWGIGNRLLTTHPFYTIPPFNRYFNPTDVPGCSLWLDGADNSSMNSTTTVTSWNDKSGLNNTMTGTATWTGSSMSFNGSTQAFSNTAYVFPISNYSMFGVYSNTTAPASNAYMNALYGSNGFPMLGTFGPARGVSARSVVANTGALSVTVGWAARIASTGGDGGQGIATDPSGNVFVTGYYGAALTFYDQGPAGGGYATLPYTGGSDCFIAKYSSAGRVLWYARIAGTSTEAGNGIATDPSGNVFVTGYYTAAVTFYNQGPSGISVLTLPFTGGANCFIAKYSSDGAVLWAARMTDAVRDIGYGIATDPSGNVFVTGEYRSEVTIYNQGPSGTVGITLPYTGGIDCFVAKYSSAGAVLWGARIAGTGDDTGFGIDTDPSGNVFVTGYYTAALTVYNQGPTGTSAITLPFTSGGNCFIAKYSSAGAVLWAARIAGTVSSGGVGYGIATDPSGNVLVTGPYYAELTIYNQGPTGTSGTTLPYTGSGDCFVAKYSSAGAVLWGARIAGTGEDNGRGIATDPSGNVFVTGYYTAALTVYNQGPSGTSVLTLPYIGSLDIFLAKYSSAGAVLWAAQIAGTTTSSDQGYGVATDTSGNVFVTGQYSAAVTIYNQGGTVGTTLTTAGSTDCFVAKYSPDGWINVVPASSNVLVSATYTPSTFSPFVNGFTAPTLAGTTLATTGIFVGGPSNYFNGTISELLIYSSNLSAAQRQQVEGYLIDKWQLRAQTLSNHQYKLIPPATPQPPQFAEVTPGNWTRDWQPELRSLIAANNPTNATVIPTISYGTGGPALSPALSTQAYFGGVLAPNGNIYCVPFAATKVLIINTTTNALSYADGPALGTFYGGVLAPNGNIYCAPFGTSNILIINPTTNTVSYGTGGPALTPALSTQYYNGCVLAPNGNIYCVPYSGTNLLIINTTTNAVSYGTGFFPDTYTGGVLAPNGNIYCVPSPSSNISIINPATNAVSYGTGGPALTPALSTQTFYGGVVAPNGNIYCVPGAASNILIINPTTNTVSYGTGGPALTPALSTQRYDGGVLAPNGNIYCMPRRCSNILIINPTTNAVSYGTGGPALTPALSTQIYDGGVLAPNGNIYCMPNGSSNILIISNTYTQLPSSNYCLSAYANKW